MTENAASEGQSRACAARAAGTGAFGNGVGGSPVACRQSDTSAAGSVESWRSRLLRYRFNWYPCYRRTGARLTFVADDLHEVRLKLPLNWRTRGYWGATFGGSVYGALDPVLLVMLARNLGPDYMVWDKSASIEFKRPGRSTLYATFRLDADELPRIRTELEGTARILRRYTVHLVDQRGVVHASCVKTLYIRRTRRRPHRERAEAPFSSAANTETAQCRAKMPESAPH